MEGILFGLAAGLCWGLADPLVPWATDKAVDPKWIVLGFHVVATVGLGVAVAVTHRLGSVRLSDLPVFVVFGAAGWVSFVAFYSALDIGPISVVSPIVSGYSAITVLLAVVVAGERPTVGIGGGVALTLAGVVVASLELGQRCESPVARNARRASVLAVVAAVGFGGFVWGVSFESHRVGWLASVFLARAFATVFLVTHIGWRREFQLPQARRVALTAVALVALLDTGGYIWFNIGVGHAQTTLVGTASAPYAVIPIAVGILIRHERLKLGQIIGVTCVIAGLVVLAAMQR